MLASPDEVPAPSRVDWPRLLSHPTTTRARGEPRPTELRSPSGLDPDTRELAPRLDRRFIPNEPHVLLAASVKAGTWNDDIRQLRRRPAVGDLLGEFIEAETFSSISHLPINATIESHHSGPNTFTSVSSSFSLTAFSQQPRATVLSPSYSPTDSRAEILEHSFRRLRRQPTIHDPHSVLAVGEVRPSPSNSQTYPTVTVSTTVAATSNPGSLSSFPAVPSRPSSPCSNTPTNTISQRRHRLKKKRGPPPDHPASIPSPLYPPLTVSFMATFFDWINSYLHDNRQYGELVLSGPALALALAVFCPLPGDPLDMETHHFNLLSSASSFHGRANLRSAIASAYKKHIGEFGGTYQFHIFFQDETRPSGPFPPAYHNDIQWKSEKQQLVVYQDLDTAEPAVGLKAYAVWLPFAIGDALCRLARLQLEPKRDDPQLLTAIVCLRHWLEDRNVSHGEHSSQVLGYATDHYLYRSLKQSEIDRLTGPVLREVQNHYQAQYGEDCIQWKDVPYARESNPFKTVESKRPWNDTKALRFRRWLIKVAKNAGQEIKDNPAGVLISGAKVALIGASHGTAGH